MKLRDILLGAAVLALAAAVARRRPVHNARGRRARAQLRQIRNS